MSQKVRVIFALMDVLTKFGLKSPKKFLDTQIATVYDLSDRQAHVFQKEDGSWWETMY